MSNMKPADELLSIRQRIKELQDREAELKDGFKSGQLDRGGDFAVVAVTRRYTKRFDRKAAEDELGSLSRFDVPTEQVVVRCEELVNPNAA
jgi:hypothetical protein